MKLLGPALLLLVGALLAFIAWRTDDPTYQAPVRAEVPEVVPVALSGDLPEGDVVRAFEVEGICCDGCSGKLYAALQPIEGVDEIAVDTILHRVEVVAREDLDVARLAAALTFDKYTARAVE